MPPILVRPADEHRVAEAQGNGRQTPRLRVKEGRTRGIVRLSADGRVPGAGGYELLLRGRQTRKRLVRASGSFGEA